MPSNNIEVYCCLILFNNFDKSFIAAAQGFDDAKKDLSKLLNKIKQQ